MNMTRRELIGSQSSLIDPHLVFYAPLTYGDLTDHVSGRLPTTINSVTWDSNVEMYKFDCTKLSTNYEYAIKWNIDWAFALKLGDSSYSGFTVIMTVNLLAYSGNGYSAWVAFPDLNEIYPNHGSTETLLKRGFAYLSEVQFNSSKPQVFPKTRVAAVFEWPNKRITWYKDGSLVSSGSWGANDTGAIKLFNHLTVCQLHSNNTRLSMRAQNIKVFDYPLSDTEIYNEYLTN